jgi:hypothetical protein
MHDNQQDPHGDPVQCRCSCPRTFRTSGRGEIFRCLEAAGIDYFAKGENLQNVPPYLHWVELLVPAMDGAEARALLADLNTGSDQQG